MENETNKKPKKEKVVVRKCHHCHKPLDEGKDFCLHCGHTYTEEDPFAAEKKAKRMKRLKKLLVFLGIVAGIALAVYLTVFFILKEINKSDFKRITEFIKSEGDFVEGTPEEELDFASELAEASRLEEIQKENEKNSQTEEETESGTEDETASGAGPVAKRDEVSESEEELTEEEVEGETEAETELEEEKVVDPMQKIETLDRYEYKISKKITLCCTEEDETTFYLILVSTVENLYTKIIVELSEERVNDRYLWNALVNYDDPNPVNSQFDFIRQYFGTLDPSTLDYGVDFSWLDITNRANKPQEDIEGEEGSEEETEGETESESESETESESKGKTTLMAKVETESESESESESAKPSEPNEENGEEGEEGEEEVVDPSTTIDEDIENAALDMVANQIRQVVKSFIDMIQEKEMKIDLDEIGFKKLYDYYISLDPLKNGQFFKQ